MTTITIPKEMIRKNDDLVLIPRKEYEAFKVWERREEAKPSRTFKTFKPTKAQIRDLKEAREEYQRGEFTIIKNRKDLEHALGIASQRSS